MTRKEANNDKIQVAYEEALRRFGQRENLTAVDVGYKYVNGEPTKTLAVRLHVKEKIEESALEAAELFPKEINGVPVDVIQANYVIANNTASAKLAEFESLQQRTQRLNPIQPGISVANQAVTAGTFGALVVDNQTGKLAILSNWHVLAGSANARPGDAVTQPGSLDGGRHPRDTVATLERMMLDADGDAAIALLTGDRPAVPAIFETGITLTGIREPRRDEVLMKSGRTTGVTFGKVDGVGRYFIPYPVGRIGVDGFKMVSRTPENPNNEELSAGGDSGAIWYDPNTREAVGLHFAGETDPSPREEHAIACFVTRVFPRLNISLSTSRPNAPEILRMETISRLVAELTSLTTAQPHNLLHLEDMKITAASIMKSLSSKAFSENTSAQSSIPLELETASALATSFAFGVASQLLSHSTGGNDAPPLQLIASAFLAGVSFGARTVNS